MVWRFLAAILASCGFTGVAYAQCTTLPNTLMNGHTADASQVMANFNGIVNCGRFAGPVGIGLTGPTVTLEVQAPGVVGDGASSASFITQFDQSGNAATRRILLTAENFRPTIQGQLLSSSWSAGDLLINPDGGSVAIGTSATPPSTFYVNGTAGGTTAWSSPSDARLKTRIEPLTNALSLVRGLNGVRYRWRPVGEREVGRSLALSVEEPQIGFIAQEVERVVPEAVVAPAKDAPDGTYALRESALVPVLVEAIKEQQAQIDALRRDLEELKGSKVKEARAAGPR
jgi:hypothetical protein